MKRVLLILLTFSFIVIYSKSSIAVFDFKTIGLDETSGEIPADFFRTYIFKSEQFNLVSREDMSLIFKEMKLQETGCTSEECYVQLGKLLSAKYILIGKIYKIDANYFITVNMIHVENAKIIYSDKNKINDLANLDVLCGKMTEKMLSSIFNVKENLTEDDYSKTSIYSDINGKVKFVKNKNYITINRGIIHGVTGTKLCYVYQKKIMVAVFLIDDVNRDYSEAKLVYYKKKTKIKAGDDIALPYNVDKRDYIRNNHFTISFNTWELFQFSYEMKRILSSKALISPELEFAMNMDHFDRFKLRLFTNINLFPITFRVIVGISNYSYVFSKYYYTETWNGSYYDYHYSSEKENKYGTSFESGIGIKIVFFPTRFYNVIMGVDFVNQSTVKKKYQNISITEKDGVKKIDPGEINTDYYPNFAFYLGLAFQF